MSKNYWVIDTDAGVDDCQAMVLGISAMHRELIDIVGITAVAGNVGLPQALINIAQTLKSCGEENLPFYPGAVSPLVAPLKVAASIHGEDGLNNYWKLNGKSKEGLPSPQEKHAAQAIIDLANEYRGELSITTIGPLTNLALAVSLDPSLPSKLKRVLVMGGAVHALGNTSFVAEFNIKSDPEAAHVVFQKFPRIEVLPWETCIAAEHQFSYEFLEEYLSRTSDKGVFIKEITKVEEGKSSVFFCDPLTLCVAVDETVAKRVEEREGHVELTGTLTRGMTVVNWGCSDEKEVNEGTGVRNLRIIEALDMQKVQELFLQSVI